jgi:hypothetical protein
LGIAQGLIYLGIMVFSPFAKRGEGCSWGIWERIFSFQFSVKGKTKVKGSFHRDKKQKTGNRETAPRLSDSGVMLFSPSPSEGGGLGWGWLRTVFSFCCQAKPKSKVLYPKQKTENHPWQETEPAYRVYGPGVRGQASAFY